MGRSQRRCLILIVVSVAAGCGANGVTPSVPASSGAAITVAPTVTASVASPSLWGASTASPTGDASSSETAAVVRHSSNRFGYSIEYPADWVVRAATDDWPRNGFPEPEGIRVDRFGATADAAPWLFVSSIVLADGKTGAGVSVKAKDMDDLRIGEMDAELSLGCSVSEKVAVTIDGVAGRRQELRDCFGTDNLLWVVVSNDVRLYLIGARGHGPIDDATRATFDRFVGSLRFDA